MKFTSKFQVLGCKGFKGQVEGTNYDSTTLYYKDILESDFELIRFYEVVE